MFSLDFFDGFQYRPGRDVHVPMAGAPSTASRTSPLLFFLSLASDSVRTGAPIRSQA